VIGSNSAYSVLRRTIECARDIGRRVFQPQTALSFVSGDPNTHPFTAAWMNASKIWLS
jgi:hypothetical protein